MNISNNVYFYTICKKDKDEYFKIDNIYPCFIIDKTACCVLYDCPRTLENLLFLNDEFVEYFYTELEVRRLKLEKLLK